jgi:hypothetical protein
MKIGVGITRDFVSHTENGLRVAGLRIAEIRAIQVVEMNIYLLCRLRMS